MPTVDLTITISAILGISAIISPILTAIINNSHQTKMKKLEMKAERIKEQKYYERDIFENFISATGQCIALFNDDVLKKYNEAYALARLYIPDELVTDIEALNDCIHSYKKEDAYQLFNYFVSKLCMQIRKL